MVPIQLSGPHLGRDTSPSRDHSSTPVYRLQGLQRLQPAGSPVVIEETSEQASKTLELRLKEDWMVDRLAFVTSPSPSVFLLA